MTTPAAEEDDEFTELVGAQFDRVDLVKRGANGVPRFLIAKSDAGAGLLNPEYVRSLIGKEAGPMPADTREDTVTMTGSPAAIAKLIHEAAQDAAERQTGVAKAEMSTKSINDLPDSDFAYIEPGGKKDEHGRTVPRSLRHFPIHDKAHVRNALSRAPQSPFGDKAMPKIRSAAKRFGIEVAKKEAAVAGVTKADIGPDLDDGIDGMDPTVPLCEPEEMGPGDPTEPGSPAWESIDAATAQKWASIAARLKNALAVMAEREMIEAASADPSDAEAAFDLADAQCAVDYVISTLAVFAAGEQAEAELGAEEMQIAKAMSGAETATASLDVFEGLAAVAKAGRVLSSANESLIREAAGNLQRVLATLPAPIEKSGQEADTKEASMPQPETSAETAAEAGQEPQMGTVAKENAEASQAAPEGAQADGEKAPVTVVYDQKGRLIGIVDPGDITPVSNAEAEPGEDDGDSDGHGETDAEGQGATPQPSAAPAALEPAPPAEVGTPAAGVAKEADEDVSASVADVIKSAVSEAVNAALQAQEAAHQEAIAKMAAEHAEKVGELENRLVTVEKSPAAPKVFTNGRVPPKEHLRGQDQGAAATQVDVAKAAELKKTLYTGTAAEQNAVFAQMQEAAVAGLAAMHAAGPQR